MRCDFAFIGTPFRVWVVVPLVIVVVFALGVGVKWCRRDRGRRKWIDRCRHATLRNIVDLRGISAGNELYVGISLHVKSATAYAWRLSHVPQVFGWKLPETFAEVPLLKKMPWEGVGVAT